MSSHENHEANVNANREFFDSLAHKYESPRAIERARRTAAAIKKVCVLDEEATAVMDFACGTGLVSRELAANVKRIVGVDVSQGMVDQFNARVFNQGIPPEEMQAFCTELQGAPGELSGEKFDIIICASAYHHFTDIDETTRTLAYFLKPEGTLAVVDLQNPEDPEFQKLEEVEGEDTVHDHHHAAENPPPDEHNHGHHHTHGSDTIIPKDTAHVHHHNGLRKAQILQAFASAGLKSVKFEPALSAIQFHHKVQLFIATGKKGCTMS